MCGPCNTCTGCECIDKADPTPCPTYEPRFVMVFEELFNGFKTKLPEQEAPPRDAQIESLRETIRVVSKDNELLSKRVDTLNKENITLRESYSQVLKQMAGQVKYGNELLAELKVVQRKLLILKEFLSLFCVTFRNISLSLCYWRSTHSLPDNKVERDVQLARGDELVGWIEGYLRKCH